MNNSLRLIYSKLYSHFKPMGWWPVILKKGEMPSYRKSFYSPLNPAQSFEVAIGAILTQNVSWKNAEKCVFNLKNADLLSCDKIISSRFLKIENLIKSSGYYRQKTKKIKLFSFWWKKNLKNFLKISDEKKREILLSLKGIGPETADSILLYALGRPFFVIDAYTKRIYNRIYGVNKENYEILREEFEKSLNKDKKIFMEFHAFLVELGKTFCFKKMPQCDDCPLNEVCIFYKRLKISKEKL